MNKLQGRAPFYFWKATRYLRMTSPLSDTRYPLINHGGLAPILLVMFLSLRVASHTAQPSGIGWRPNVQLL